jgi:hypothetical protein
VSQPKRANSATPEQRYEIIKNLRSLPAGTHFNTSELARRLNLTWHAVHVVELEWRREVESQRPKTSRNSVSGKNAFFWTGAGAVGILAALPGLFILLLAVGLVVSLILAAFGVTAE